MNSKYEKLIKALNSFKDKSILVLGDLILDKFVRGKVSRISPEAPVPIVNITDEIFMPGGAGNVVNNIVKLGSRVTIGGVVGDDIFGEQLIHIFKDHEVEVSGIFKDALRPTSLKTRVIAEHQQIVRTDLESKEEIPSDIVKKINNWIEKTVGTIDGIVISDYGKGLITTDIIKNTIKIADGKNIPIVVDPQVGHFFEYNNVTAITPNVKEAGEALKIIISDEDTLIEAGKRLLNDLNCKTVLITRGEQGMTLFMQDGNIEYIPTLAKEVYDVSGAGDTVVSVFTIGLTVGLDFVDAAILSNYAAAVVVAKLGTATASVEEIIKEIKK